VIGEDTVETRLYNWVRGDLKAVVEQKRQQNEARELLAQGEVDRAILAATGGRYERLQLLGQGGMGRVVRAWDTRMQRDVAIKTILDTASDPDACMRFHREARALGRVRHPNVVEVIDYSGRGAALPFIVLELIDGANLNAIIHVTALPELVALCVLRDLCDAVAAIHEQGLIHRDLKPENIFTEASGRVVVGDFGIVRGAEGQSSTFVRSVTHSVGSPLFSSPEQLFSVDSITSASDMFSLGSVLYAMLFGKSPFLAEGIAATLARVGDAQAAPVPVGTDPFIKRLLGELLQKDATTRPSAENVRDRVQRELSRRGVLDARQQIRLFLGSEEPESHTRIFELAQTNVRTKITPSARDGATNIVTSTAVKAMKEAAPARPASPPSEPTPRRAVTAVAAGGLLIVLAGGAVLFAQRPKPLAVEAPPAALPPPRETIIPPPETAIAPPSPVDIPVVPKIVSPPVEAKPKLAPAKPSVVRIFAKPWAKVTIDGEVSGTTPVFKTTELPAGRHVFLFENPAFKSERVVVDLKAGEPKDIRVQLVK
jgi:serine/threonine-protein kinase